MGRQAIARDEINLADSICHPNARHVTAFSCATGVTSNFGCMTVDNGQVPQQGQFAIGISHIAGSNPTTINGITYPYQPNFFLIINVQPQNPNFGGVIVHPNIDLPTAILPGATACGYECVNGCQWTGLPNATYATYNDCDNAVNAGTCLTQPTHFCEDYNVFEISYSGGVSALGTPGAMLDETTVLNTIISRTTGGLYPYSDVGGVWDGFSLAQMTSTIGTPAVGGTSIYNPLKGSLDDCIACCGGVNQEFYSNGVSNPYYEMSNNPTPHAGYAAYLAANSLPQHSGTFIDYMLSIGIDSCGLTANNAGVRI